MSRSLKWRAALMCLLLSGMPVAHAGEEDMLSLARLWSEVRATHPALADERIDWDRALAGALPLVQGEDSEARLRGAVAAMMAPLHDPALRIGLAMPEFVRWPLDGPVLEWLPGDTALLHLHPGIQSNLASFVVPARARRVVLDVRPLDQAQDFATLPVLHAVVAQLIAQPLLLPAQRYRYSTGPRQQDPLQWQGVQPGFMQMEAQRLQPAPGARLLPMVLLVNDTQPVPGAALALQRAGLAHIVAEGGGQIGPVQSLWLHGLGVEFAAGQLVWPDGSAAVWRADQILSQDRATGAGSAPVRAALLWLSRPHKAHASRPQPAMTPVRQDDAPYRDMRFPDRSWRMLAAIKLWATMDKYFPARRLMDGSWDAALLQCLQRMEQVGNAREYGQALEAMAAHLDDSHVGIGSRALGWSERTHGIGLQLVRIDGHIVVASVTDPALVNTLRPGDEIVRIDDEDVNLRLRRLGSRVAASSEAGRWRKAMEEMLLGPASASVTLRVASADGSVRSVMAAPISLAQQLPVRHGSAAVDVQQGIAYVDLVRLAPHELEAMFHTIAGSRALILDVRGYPQGTGGAIASRLNVNQATVFATSAQQLTLPWQAGEGAQLLYADRLAPASGPLYRGKVVMLINEHTQSAAEHLALMLEAGANATFIGTPSAGADGDLREVVLPGNVHVWYSGLEVRHADGRQLQRVGVQPHIAVAPTMAGLRAGRDEVLERALEFLHPDQE